MTERNIATRPSMDQVVAIVEFMEEHLPLGLGQLRDMEGREESKRLWLDLTRIINTLPGPVRSMKSWIKFWADKKTNVRSKVITTGGDPTVLSSHIDRKIWDVFLSNTDCDKPRRVKKERESIAEAVFEEADDESCEDAAVTEEFVAPVTSVEERQMAIMEKLAKVMVNQAEAMSQLAVATQINARAMEKLADASHIQARAIDRIAGSFDSIGVNSLDVRNSIAEIDSTLKLHFYNTPTT